MAQDFAQHVNENLGGWNQAMGLRIVEATVERVIGEWTITPVHHQPYGIVHGGVHSGVIEALCSIGAALDARERGLSVVGLENHTSFIKAAREGVLRCTATPVAKGRRSQVWEGAVRDASDRLIASGRVRLWLLEADAELAGKKVEMRPAGAKD